MIENRAWAPLFGISITPSVRDIPLALKLAKLADDQRLDALSIQDHPYNPEFLDTWTLLALLGGLTQHVRLVPNVANLPLRPPAMLAKAAASLDLLTHGRVELGLGAGALWEAVVSYGGPNRTPGEAVEALEEGIHVMRALWQNPQPGQGIRFQGRHYQLNDAQPGPAPAHDIGIFLGALGPRMLRLTGKLANGWIISTSYIPPEDVPAARKIIDNAAQEAGRSPSDIQGWYNLMGMITRPGTGHMRARRKGVIVGTAAQWAEEITRYYRELKMDGFYFWPAAGDEEYQIRAFADEVIPAVRTAVNSSAS